MDRFNYNGQHTVYLINWQWGELGLDVEAGVHLLMSIVKSITRHDSRLAM